MTKRRERKPIEWYPPDTDDNYPYNHEGRWIQTEHGWAHVLVDPDVSPETMAALTELIKCAQKAVEDGTIGAPTNGHRNGHSNGANAPEGE